MDLIYVVIGILLAAVVCLIWVVLNKATNRALAYQVVEDIVNLLSMVQLIKSLPCVKDCYVRVDKDYMCFMVLIEDKNTGEGFIYNHYILARDCASLHNKFNEIRDAIEATHERFVSRGM